LDSRKDDFLRRLLENLEKQTGHPDVEVIICTDKGKATTGEKRNQLLRAAQGDYIAFVDDDDLVAPNYVDLILDAIQTNPDVVGMNLIMTVNGKKAERSYHSLDYKTWFDVPDPTFPGHRVYFRNPNHLNPVKREIALAVGFPDITEAEDKAYSKGIQPLLKTEVKIDQPIYYYLFRSKS
jgi:glycosyltransferase involved in cell wall biosynthesis